MFARLGWLSLLVAIAAPTPALADASVYLGPGYAWSIGNGRRASGGFLARELVRQAFLIAAREECGALTRDAWLGDPPPADGSNPPFDLVCSAGKSSLVEVLRGFGPAQEVVWHDELPIKLPLDYPAFVTQMESMSRGEFVRVLEQQGLKRQPPIAKSSETELPSQVSKWLDEMEFTSQFAALRQLHSLPAANRDNPARLAGLVRAYSNLGLMSEYFFSPMHQVFKARALLYAERLVALSQRSPWALAHRAYVRALVGLHAAAVEDLGAAGANGDQSRLARPPKWTVLLKQFCTFDAVGIKTVADPSLAQLAALLRLVMAEQSDVPGLTPRVAIAESANAPECYRICDGYLQPRYFNHPDIHEKQPANGSATMARTLYDRLHAIPGLPDSVAAEADGNPNDELARRQEVMQTLLAPEAKSNSHAGAGEEISWPLLGRIVQEISFYQAWRDIKPGDDNLVASDETITRLEPLYADHRYAGFLELALTDSKNRQKAYEQLLKSIDAEALEFHDSPIVDCLWHLPNGHFQGDGFFATLENRGDGVARDLARRTKAGPLAHDVKAAHALLAVSPYNPAARAVLIEFDWNAIQSQAADWQRTSSSQPQVLTALAKHIASDDPAKAESLLRAAVDSSPTFENLAALALNYAKQDKRGEWLKVMKRLVAVAPAKDLGAVHASILNYYMQKGDRENGLEEAAAAAESKTSAGLLAAAAFYESQQEWDAADDCYHQASESDQSQVFEWYYYCRRTGEGSEKAARKLAADFLARREQMKNEFPQGFLYLLMPSAVYYSLANKSETARGYFTEEFSRTSDPFAGLHAALISDQLKELPARDQMLADIARRRGRWERMNPKRHVELFALAAMFADDLKKKEPGDLDLDAVKKLFAHATEIERVNCDYFVGQYLFLRGKTDKAIEIWTHAISNLQMHAFNRTLAGAALAANGMTPNMYEDAMKRRFDKSNSNDATPK